MLLQNVRLSVRLSHAGIVVSKWLHVSSKLFEHHSSFSIYQTLWQYSDGDPIKLGGRGATNAMGTARRGLGGAAARTLPSSLYQITAHPSMASVYTNFVSFDVSL